MPLIKGLFVEKEVKLWAGRDLAMQKSQTFSLALRLQVWAAGLSTQGDLN